jgi:hypothetical protein
VKLARRERQRLADVSRAHELVLSQQEFGAGSYFASIYQIN